MTVVIDSHRIASPERGTAHYARRVNWAEHLARAERRYADGEGRIPADPDGRQKQLVRLGMRERVTALGGQLAIGAATGQGVRLDAHIPLQEAT